MNRWRYFAYWLVLALLVNAGSVTAQGIGPGGPDLEGAGAALASASFTYQGWLQSGGSPVSAACDFQFGLWDALADGEQLGATQTVTSLTVTGGRFTVVLNAAAQFGARAFDGSARWLAIAVRCPAGGGYTTLTPRQALTAAPLALALPGLRTEPNASSPNVVGGYISNSVALGIVGATIAGGGAASIPNTVTGIYGTVGGGRGNTASGHATVAGGYNNTANAGNATVAGGLANTADAQSATVAGGEHNTASGVWSTVASGNANTTSNFWSTVGGGDDNTASALGATVAGGESNTASGDYSFAAGYNAHALHNGAFVWSSNAGTLIASTAVNQFLVRATGGISLTTNATGATGCSLSAGGGTWNCTSDRNAKANFAPVNGVAVLDTLMAIPIQTWNFNTQDAAIRHMGPMAQDWHAAYGLGENATTISAVDADGVAVAAIQGLYTVVQAQTAEIAALRAVNTTQQEQIAALQSEQAVITTRLAALDGPNIGVAHQRGATGLPALPWLLLTGLLLLNAG